MALRNLVEEECGSSSPLVRLTSHLTRDAGFVDDGVTHPFQTPEQNQTFGHHPESSFDDLNQSFKMDTLVSEMRALESASNIPPPPSIMEQVPLHHEPEVQNKFVEPSRHNWMGIPSLDDEMYKDLDEESKQFLRNEANEFMNYHGTQVPFGYFPEIDPPSTNPMNNERLGRVLGDIMFKMGEDPRFKDSQFLGYIENIADGNLHPQTAKDIQGMRHQMEVFDQWADEVSGLKANEEKFINDMIAKKLNETSKRETTKSQQKENVQSIEERSGPGNVENIAGPSKGQVTEELWTKLTERWEEMTRISGDEMLDMAGDRFFFPTHDYKFVEENPMLNDTNALKKGKQRLQNGDWPGAVLCFEAAVQQDKNNPEAWLLLGKTQAENEQDPQAITALRNCLRLDDSNLDALMSVAVSYANENYQYQSCYALKEWLRCNSKYSYLLRNYKEEQEDKPRVTSILKQKFYDTVSDMYTKALSQQSFAECVDPDIQNGMGILKTLNSDHVAASDYFLAAVRERPDDSRLWNRLGATLANGGKTLDAMEAYRNALKLSPGFIRARYNLGITYMHMRMYKDAIENLLTALNLQVSGRGVMGEKSEMMSDSIWTTMRLAISLFGKRDLLPLIDKRNLNQLNQEFGVTP